MQGGAVPELWGCHGKGPPWPLSPAHGILCRTPMPEAQLSSPQLQPGTTADLLGRAFLAHGLEPGGSGQRGTSVGRLGSSAGSQISTRGGVPPGLAFSSRPPSPPPSPAWVLPLTRSCSSRLWASRLSPFSSTVRPAKLCWAPDSFSRSRAFSDSLKESTWGGGGRQGHTQGAGQLALFSRGAKKAQAPGGSGTG